MKLSVATLTFTTLFSLSSYANWYVDRVSCLKDRNDGTHKTDVVSVEGKTLEKFTFVREITDAPPKRVEDSSDFSGRYETLSKINPRTVWTGVFDWITIYDGMNLENGQVGPVNGVTMESRIEIRFKPFTDLAYGPDYATVSIFAKIPGGNQWQLKSSSVHCRVTVYH